MLCLFSPRWVLSSGSCGRLRARPSTTSRRRPCQRRHRSQRPSATRWVKKCRTCGPWSSRRKSHRRCHRSGDWIMSHCEKMEDFCEGIWWQKGASLARWWFLHHSRSPNTAPSFHAQWCSEEDEGGHTHAHNRPWPLHVPLFPSCLLSLSLRCGCRPTRPRSPMTNGRRALPLPFLTETLTCVSTTLLSPSLFSHVICCCCCCCCCRAIARYYSVTTISNTKSSLLFFQDNVLRRRKAQPPGARLQ
ncbi:hypothetical protein TCSYLVIO_007061 [Trypanosoma cruzi]|nr:hypothetical protein TCSYLVIO_007061 [Trypanosoma cruzi]